MKMMMSFLFSTVLLLVLSLNEVSASINFDAFLNNTSRFEGINNNNYEDGEDFELNDYRLVSEFFPGATFYNGRVAWTNNNDELIVPVTEDMGVTPYNHNGRLLLPIRYVAYGNGLANDRIEWNNSTQTVTIKNYDGNVLTIKVGENSLNYGGTNVKIDAAATMKSGRVLIPVRAVSEAFGNKVTWNSNENWIVPLKGNWSETISGKGVVKLYMHNDKLREALSFHKELY